MTFEPVLMIWDFYDGARTGLAGYKGQPHYFKCLWDESANNYSDEFELSSVDDSFLLAATTQWKIYTEWQRNHSSGLALSETHPGNRGINPEYDKLDDELTKRIGKLIKLPARFVPEFRVKSAQDTLPKGILRDLEVNWKKIK